MSIQFGIASVLTRGAIDERCWSEFANAAVNDLAQRITVIADPALSSASPAKQGARIAVKLRDGRLIERRQDDFRSMSHDDVVHRFMGAAEPTIPTHDAAIPR